MKTPDPTAPAHNGVHDLETMPAILAATSPGGVPKEKLHPYETATPEGRRFAFNQIVDGLMKPTTEGGKGRTLDKAIQAMKGNEDHAALLKAMGKA